MNFGKIKNRIISYFKKENKVCTGNMQEKTKQERDLIIKKLETDTDFRKNLFYLQDSMGYVYSKDGITFTYIHIQINDILRCYVNKHSCTNTETCEYNIDLFNKKLSIIEDKYNIFFQFIDILIK